MSYVYWEVELGRVVGRGELYIATHKKKDGSYVNEKARSIGKLLGNDHVGRVHCLGLRGLHSVAFQSTTGFSGGIISLKDKLASSKESVKTLKNVMLAYIQMKKGHISTKLGAMFGSTSNVAISTSYIYVKGVNKMCQHYAE
ncbi:hypothetical protein CR513_46008, partial [Mucuna pruriens]